jgi:hypothetical protein
MERKELDDGYVKLSVPNGKVRDRRTRRTYREVVCKLADEKHFETA